MNILLIKGLRVKKKIYATRKHGKNICLLRENLIDLLELIQVKQKPPGHVLFPQEDCFSF